ncbi:MAG: LacI family DNA-binding transcriptional regulator [Clostridia bacterium]|nr:LacI family DNA-binding transcriptional regulator [Clostridia bacterium]
MKNSFSAAAVAEALGVSINTVYRAINHSGLVKSTTQQRILDYIRENYPDRPTETNHNDTRTITVLTQIKPKYYWQESIDEMRAALEEYPSGALRLRTIFYAGVRNENALCDALSQLSPETTDALIVVPVGSGKGSSIIKQLAEQIPVLALCDYGDYGSHCLGVHGDGRAEGEEAANMVALSSAKTKRVLILRSMHDSKLVDDRISGFRDCLANRPGCSVADELDLSDIVNGDYNYHSTLPAMIARQIADYFADHPGDDINCFYISDGLIAPVCSAQIKLGRPDIRCFGHEHNDIVQRFFESGIKGGSVRSDIRAQSRLAIRIIADKLLYGRDPENQVSITPFESCLIDN